MSPRRPSLAAALAVLAAAAAPASAGAQSSKADAFAGKIPPVSGLLYQKSGRVEVTGTVNLSLNDAFYNKYFGGVKATYHFNENWAAGLHATGGVTSQTSSAEVCSPTKGCASADATAMHQVPGKIKWIVGAEGAWAPIYGKLNVFSEQAAHFDLSLLAGPDVIAYQEVLSKADAETRSPGTSTSLGGHVGLGLRLFFTDAVAARLEFKDYIYSVNIPNGGIGNDIQNQLFAEIGLSYFFGGRRAAAR